MRPSVRRTTASSQTTTSETWTRTTPCSSPSWLRQLRGAHRALSVHVECTVSHCDDTAHLMAQVLSSHIVISIPSMAHSPWFDLYLLYFSFLSFSVYFFHNQLFLDLDNPVVMESLCYSAVEKSEGTLNASHSFTKSVRSSFDRTVMGRAIWENPVEVRLGEGFQ